MVKRVFWGIGFAGLLGLPLEAAKDGWFAEIGAQYSHAAGSYAVRTSNSTTKWPFSGDMGGVDFQGGYKQFFGKKRHWGLRYYGLISLQGGGGFHSKPVTNTPPRGLWVVISMAWALMRFGISIVERAMTSGLLWAWLWGGVLGLWVRERLMMCAKPGSRVVIV